MQRSEQRRHLIETPHGRCVIVELADGVEPPLHAGEEILASRLSPTRRRELAAGRAALRDALGQEVAILVDDRGAPVLPSGWVGSISHKGGRAAGLVAPASEWHVGVDLEVAVPARQAIERRILTERERERLGEPREITRAFAIKEAIYKAVDPFVRRYVAFTEVELAVDPSGACDVHIVDGSYLPVVIEAWWREHDGHWLATARARRR